MNETTSDISTDSSGGATVKTLYVERQIKAFAVFETEIQALSSLNAQATIFFSVASGALSFASGIWTNSAFAENPTPEALVASKMVAPALLIIAIVFLCLGIHAWHRRTATVNSIREQSTSVAR